MAETPHCRDGPWLGEGRHRYARAWAKGRGLAAQGSRQCCHQGDKKGQDRQDSARTHAASPHPHPQPCAPAGILLCLLSAPGPPSLQPSPPLQPDGNLPVRWGKRSDDTDEHPKLQCGLRGDHVPEPEQGGPGLPHQSACARPAVSTRLWSLPTAELPHAAPAPAQGLACRQSVPQLLRGPVFPNIY